MLDGLIRRLRQAAGSPRAAPGPTPERLRAYRGGLVAAVLVLLSAAGVAAVQVRPPGGSPRPGSASAARQTTGATGAPAGAAPATPALSTSRASPPPSVDLSPRRSAPPTAAAPPSTNLPLAGCPPPPYTGPKPGPPWHPAALVPDAQLGPTPPAPRRRASTAPLTGKGIWIWELDQTAHGDPAAIVADARAIGLRQLWVRVADSRSGFYNAGALSRLVPAAHRAGLAVIGWGFPYLYDPAGDARWTEQALDWRTRNGDHLDGFSADVETSSEGVDLSGRRASLYLGLVRQADPGSLLVATVFPPSDSSWATYPYLAMAPYVDALAPMVYWGCVQPVAEAEQALARLAPLAPVHLIGQAYDMGPEGGRQGPPAPAEIEAFLEAAHRGGALGASLWSWQAIDGADWLTLGAYRW